MDGATAASSRRSAVSDRSLSDLSPNGFLGPKRLEESVLAACPRLGGDGETSASENGKSHQLQSYDTLGCA